MFDSSTQINPNAQRPKSVDTLTALLFRLQKSSTDPDNPKKKIKRYTIQDEVSKFIKEIYEEAYEYNRNKTEIRHSSNN